MVGLFVKITMNNVPTHRPTRPKIPPHVRINRCIEQIDRVLGFVDTLRDSIELTGIEHGERLASRAYVCDHIADELRSIVGRLDDIRPMVMRRE